MNRLNQTNGERKIDTNARAIYCRDDSGSIETKHLRAISRLRSEDNSMIPGSKARCLVECVILVLRIWDDCPVERHFIRAIRRPRQRNTGAFDKLALTLMYDCVDTRNVP